MENSARPKRRICNWCAAVADEPVEALWFRADLRIEGLDDGSVSWLPTRVLDFCNADDCMEQLDRVEDFLRGMPHGKTGIRVRLVVSDTEDGATFYEERLFDHEGAAEDVRALARFFNETSHPRLRRVLEAFRDEHGEPGSPPDLADPRGPQSSSEDSGVACRPPSPDPLP